MFQTIKKLVPATLPARIYRLLFCIPPFRCAANAFIRSLIPEKKLMPEGVLFLNRSDVAVSAAIAYDMFEETELQLFRDAVKPGMTVADIGANIGLYTIVAARLVGESGKVFAYEPEPANFSLLKRNVGANALSNVILSDVAVAEKAGTAALYLDPDNKGSHSFAQSEIARDALTVKTDTLDHLLAGHGSPIIDVIKMDIEGAEELALRGMTSAIARSPRLKIFTEFYPERIDAVSSSAEMFLKHLREKGFSLEVIEEDQHETRTIGNIADIKTILPSYEKFINILARR